VGGGGRPGFVWTTICRWFFFCGLRVLGVVLGFVGKHFGSLVANIIKGL